MHHLSRNVKAAPARPKARPSPASSISSAASQTGSSVTAKVNFSSPSSPEVRLAHSAAVPAGRSARCSSLPAVSTSMAKAVAAKGVLNRPAKPAAMPVISMSLGASSVFKIRPARCEMAAPSCTATPSRPALPPNRCVSQVAHMTKGTSLSGISPRSPWPASNTMPMPPSQPLP